MSRSRRHENYNRYFSCTRKWVHEDYWTAMLHARIVQRLNPGSLVAIYPCRFCDGIHVGRTSFNAKWIAGMKKLEKIMSHPNFWLKAPKHIQDQMVYAREEIQAMLDQSADLRERTISRLPEM